METYYVNKAVKQISTTAFGRYLLENFPVKVVTPTQYSEQYKVLAKHGSPACTDGKDVYVSPKILGEYLSKTFHYYSPQDIASCSGDDKRWSLQPSDKEWVLSQDQKVNEATDVILHELTHAINEHVKVGIAASKKSDLYQRKLAVACELQANDGIMGRTYELCAMQQLPGVTNKRMHQETFGCHTLASIMNKLELTEDERYGRGSASSQSKAQQDMAKATGEYAKIEQAIEQDKKTKKEGEDANRSNGQEEATTTSKVVNGMAKKGLQKIKELMLASLTDELKYDPLSNSVLWNDVRKRVRKQTYSRPSKRIGMYGSQQYQVLRKGTKIERVKEPDTANKLTVLAVDASGSMRCQQKYVASLLDDLLKQVKEQAEKLNIEVHYENLLAMTHRTQASELYPVTSQEWKVTMENYNASGGNDFGCILGKINQKALKLKDYDNVTVINLGDGLDTINERWVSGTKVDEYIEQGKLTWIDALVNADPTVLREAEMCKDMDCRNIREQLLITTEQENIF